MAKKVTILSLSAAILTGIIFSCFASKSLASDSSIVRIRFFHTFNEGYKVTSQCSGVFTSNTGYLLTNRHCLVGGVLSEATQIELDKDFSQRKQFDVLKKVKLSVAIDNGNASVPEKIHDASIVSAGAEIDLEKILSREFVNIMKNIDSEDFNIPDLQTMLVEMLKNGFGPQSDWIVLKVEGIDQTKCLKVTKSDSESVQMIGYPAEKNGDRFSNSNIEIAKGEFDKEQRCFMNIGREKIKNVTDEQQKNQIIELTKLMLSKQTPTTAKVQAGMSGGPTLNSSNELVGLNRAAIPECSNSSFYVPIQSIIAAIDSLASHAGTPSAKEIFDCKIR